jgi:hypothetical protein
MATIALRVPTTGPDQQMVVNGQTYILFERGPTEVRALIAAKVRAELRKFRAGGLAVCSLPLLLPEGFHVSTGALSEALAIDYACAHFAAGGYLLLCDGQPLTSLDDVVHLTRDTQLRFVAVPAINEVRA